LADPQSILLIYPPVAKPCEPPAGIARLAGALRAGGIDCRVVDASLEGVLDLLDYPIATDDTWSRRAVKHREANQAALRAPELYGHPDRYKRAVMDINRVLQMAGRAAGVTLSLANYASPALSPVRSRDLVQAAETFETNLFFPNFSARLASLFAEREPDVIGLSINFMSQALCAFAMIGFIKKQFPKARIICGGGLVTSWMHIPGFNNPFQGLVDELVSGPGEQILLEMCGGKVPEAAPGWGYDFSSLAWDQYLSPGRVLPYSTSQGCYWRKCAFCPEKSEKSTYRPMSPSAVVTEVRSLAQRYAPRLIHFLDNALSPKLMADLVANPPGVPWYGFVRITPHLADPEFVAGLKASGCVMLKLGVESGDQTVLDGLSKGVDLATVSGALKALKQVGIATYVYLLFGTPAETQERARHTLDFTLAHSDAIDFLNLAVFNLPAYSDEAAALQTVPFYEGDLSLYREFVHPAGWQRDQVRRFLSREFKKPAPIRTILNNDPPFFTSNHAAFFAR
jgi:radical SAM family protein